MGHTIIESIEWRDAPGFPAYGEIPLHPTFTLVRGRNASGKTLLLRFLETVIDAVSPREDDEPPLDAEVHEGIIIKYRTKRVMKGVYCWSATAPLDPMWVYGTYVGTTAYSDEEAYSKAIPEPLSAARRRYVLEDIMERRTCPLVLIDDFADGLDFENARLLYEEVEAKASREGFQVVAATVNRDVVNAVPIDRHLVTRKTEKGYELLHIKKDKELFDDFKFTGLNNDDLVKLWLPA